MVREIMHFWVIQCDMLNLDRFIQMLWDAEFQSTMCGCVIVGLFLFGRCLDCILAFPYLLLHNNCLYHLVPFVSFLLHNSVRHCPPVPSVHRNLVGGAMVDSPAGLDSDDGGGFRSRSGWPFVKGRRGLLPLVLPFLFCPSTCWNKGYVMFFFGAKQVWLLCVCDSTRMKPWYIQPSSFSGCWLDLPMEHNWTNLNEPESKGILTISQYSWIHECFELSLTQLMSCDNCSLLTFNPSS